MQWRNPRLRLVILSLTILGQLRLSLLDGNPPIVGKVCGVFTSGRVIPNQASRLKAASQDTFFKQMLGPEVDNTP
jgi:hypothetical protein